MPCGKPVELLPDCVCWRDRLGAYLAADCSYQAKAFNGPPTVQTVNSWTGPICASLYKSEFVIFLSMDFRPKKSHKFCSDS